MRRIFIVEPDDMVIEEDVALERIGGSVYRPNFTTPGGGMHEPLAGKGGGYSSAQVVNAALLDVALAKTPISMLPPALQVALAIARPVISQYLLGDPKDITDEVRKQEAQEFSKFLEKYAITLRVAKLANFKFPPGHPQVGQTYLLHPLADLPGSGKECVYIPHEVYDDILLSERESELLKLLVELGATKVSITKKQSNQAASKISAEVAGGSKIVGEAGVKVSTKAEDEASSLDSRTFELAGKLWRKGETLDRSKFAWVSYEPSWEALISAREIGGCLKAAIEIKDDASFATDRELIANLKFKGISGKASAKASREHSEERSYIVKVEFLPVVDPGG